MNTACREVGDAEQRKLDGYRGLIRRESENRYPGK